MHTERTPLAITADNTTFHAADSFLLRKPAKPVLRQELYTSDIKMIVKDLLNVAGATTNLEEDTNKATMVGLHAKQLGYDKNIFVFWSNYKAKKDRPEDYKPQFRLLINPEITASSNAVNDNQEGCFSINSVGSMAVPRPNSIRFSGLEVAINEFQKTGNFIVSQVENEKISDPYIARIFQHEEHHGRGIRFPAIAKTLNRKGKPDEQLSPDEEARVRAMSHPLPSKGPETIVVMKNLKAA